MPLHIRRPLSESVVIDDARNVLTAYGTDIDGDLLASLGEPTPPGQWFRIIKTENGVATIQMKREEDFR